MDDVQDMGSTIKKVDAISRATAGQQLRNWRLVGNQFYSPGDGTPYQIEGPANFQLNAMTRSHWSINGNFSAMIQSMIEVHIGGYSGKENTLSWTLNVNIPQGYYRKIQVWEYLTKWVMEALPALNEVAYVRFASVYRQFRDVNEFMAELKQFLGESGKHRA